MTYVDKATFLAQNPISRASSRVIAQMDALTLALIIAWFWTLKGLTQITVDSTKISADETRKSVDRI